MDEQNQDTPQLLSLSATSAPGGRPSVSRSVPALRFPRPQGSQDLANWVSTSSPDIMSPSATPGHPPLAESTYEIITSTDGESQDEPMTSSVSSLDYAHNDDLQSLNGSDHGFGTDSDDEQEQHSSSSIRYADQALQHPSARFPAPTYRIKNLPASTMQSIEFLEGHGDRSAVMANKISVKHTIREFTEVESAAIAQDMGMAGVPKRLAATIRQTMSSSCLSTRQPLRILYVGSPAARLDIVYKLSSAICASAPSDPIGKATMFNIFPISNFGSNQVPEVHLMENPGRQIQVEDCVHSEEVIARRDSSDEISYSLTIDGGNTYNSAITVEGLQILPQWATLPHIAIFFCTENDDVEIEKTRTCAWEFMNRHGVPSIFISNNQLWNHPPAGRWRDFVDQHAVHLCLESRDPLELKQPHRLPIDLTSFLNIDARQMNRNLTYLTGLADLRSLKNGLSDEQSWKPSRPVKPLTILYRSREVFKDYAMQRYWVVPLLMSVLGGLISVLVSTVLINMASPALQPGALSTRPAMSLATTIPVAPTRAPTLRTTTVAVNVTSTKTVKMRQTVASASTLASVMSFAGFLSDKASTAVPVTEPKKSICSVELYGNQEILVRIAAGNKAMWLAKGAIDIDVCRGNGHIKTKLSSTDEGIVLELNQKDAYGILNVTVITARKPKINQTFEVNFGKPVVVEAFETGMHILHSLADKISSTADDVSNIVGNNYFPAMVTAAEKLHREASSVLNQISVAGKAAQVYSQSLGEGAVARAKNSLQPKRILNLVANAQQRVTDIVPSLPQNVRQDMSYAVLRAQIVSKLWWLKVQHKVEQHAIYKRKAAKLIKKTHDAISQDRKARAREEASSRLHERKARTWFRQISHRRGGSKQGNNGSSQGKERKSRGWTRLILG